MIIPTILLLYNCSNDNYTSMLHKSTKECIKRNYKKDLEHYYSLKKYGRINFVLNSLDSVVNKLVAERGYDTIYVSENYGPPLSGYYNFVWRKGDQYIYEISHYKCYKMAKINVYEDQKEYFPLIENWNKNEIYRVSSLKPLAWCSRGVKREIVANRLIFKNKKCISVESIIFGEIDFFREKKLMRNKKIGE